MGTPEYMAPEQAYSADLADSRSDVFSLGVILFEMLSGKRPIEGETPQIIAEKILTGQVLRLDELCPNLPSGLTKVVHTCMAADPDHRWKDAAAVRDALLPFVPKAEPLHSPYGVSPASSHVPFSGLTKTPRVDGVNVRIAESAPPTRLEASGGTEIGGSGTGAAPPMRAPEKTAPPTPGVPMAVAPPAPRTVSMPLGNDASRANDPTRGRPAKKSSVSRWAIAIRHVELKQL
jgi:serine/threonine-protein kinase